jgi:FixJ family two-component response regulator
MPELSGVELARRLYELCPSCRIFLLSATEFCLIEACAAKEPTPAFSFFGKPVPIVELLDSVATSFGSTPHIDCSDSQIKASKFSHPHNAAH